MITDFVIRPLNYLWHSVAAPSLHLNYYGADIYINRLNKVETITAEDAIKFLKSNMHTQDLVHQGIKLLKGQSICSIADEGEEMRLSSLAELLETEKIASNIQLLLVEQENPFKRNAVYSCIIIGTMQDFLQKTQDQVAKVAKYDMKHPLWEQQRLRTPSPTYKELTAL